MGHRPAATRGAKPEGHSMTQPLPGIHTAVGVVRDQLTTVEYSLSIDWARAAEAAIKAANNKTGTSRDGPLLVTITARRPAP